MGAKWQDFRQTWEHYLDGEMVHLRLDSDGVDIKSEIVRDALRSIEVRSYINEITPADRLLITLLRASWGHPYTPKNGGQ